MKRMSLVAGLAVAVACVGAPVAASGAPAVPSTPAAPSGPAVPGVPGGPGGEATPGTPGGPGTPNPPTDPSPPPEPTPSTEYVVWGCLTQNATPAGAPMRVMWGNRQMRTALGEATTFTVGINARTSVRHGWSWQRSSWWGPRSTASGVAGLRAGDIVTAFITAPSGTAAAALPAAGTILDFGRYGRSRGCSVR